MSLGLVISNSKGAQPLMSKRKKSRISHSTFGRKIDLIFFVLFAQRWNESDSTGSNLVGVKEWWKIRNKKINKNAVEESWFQTKKFKLDWKGAKKIVKKREIWKMDEWDYERVPNNPTCAKAYVLFSCKSIFN